MKVNVALGAGLVFAMASFQVGARDLGSPVGTVYDAAVVDEVRFLPKDLSVAKPLEVKLAMGECTLTVSMATALTGISKATFFGRTESLACAGDPLLPRAVQGSVIGEYDLVKSGGVLPVGRKLRVSLWESQAEQTMRQLGGVIGPILEKTQQMAQKDPTPDNLAAQRVAMQTAMGLADAYSREFVSPEEKAKK